MGASASDLAGSLPSTTDLGCGGVGDVRCEVIAADDIVEQRRGQTCQRYPDRGDLVVHRFHHVVEVGTDKGR